MAQQIVKTQICECTNCGNEAEMQITCTLPDPPAAPAAGKPATEKKEKVQGHAVCKNCGNEADMWIDL